MLRSLSSKSLSRIQARLMAAFVLVTFAFLLMGAGAAQASAGNPNAQQSAWIKQRFDQVNACRSLKYHNVHNPHNPYYHSWSTYVKCNGLIKWWTDAMRGEQISFGDFVKVGCYGSSLVLTFVAPEAKWALTAVRSLGVGLATYCTWG